MNEEFKQLPTRRQQSSQSLRSSRNALRPASQDHFFMASGIRKRRIFYNVQYTQEQRQAVKEVRQALLREKGIDIRQKQVLLRYWYSNNLKMPNTLHNLQAYHKWFTDPQVQIVTPECRSLLKSGFNYCYDFSLDARPFAVMQMGIVDLDKFKLSSYMQAMNHVNNKMIDEKLVPGKVQTYDYILDLNEKLLGLPISALRDIVGRISEAYSMMLGNMYIINITSFAKFLSNGIEKMLSQETRLKIKFFSAEEVRKGALCQFISEDVLQQKYGGKHPNINYQQLFAQEIPQTYRSQLDISQQTQYFSIDEENPMFTKHQSEVCCGTGECTIY